MAIGNGELMHECFIKHSRMGIARMKKGKETQEDANKIGVCIERSNAGMKENEVPTGL